MAFTPEYEGALDALSRAADTMTRVCGEYQHALKQGDGSPLAIAKAKALRQTCEEARKAHDEALADAWEMIEEQGADGDSRAP